MQNATGSQVTRVYYNELDFHQRQNRAGVGVVVGVGGEVKGVKESENVITRCALTLGPVMDKVLLIPLQFTPKRASCTPLP